MKFSKTKTTAIVITLLLAFSLTASVMLMPTTSAHTPPWQIPTYAYIVAEPNPIGVGQTMNVYMWLDELYGDVGGATATVGTNGTTSSGALLSNNYRFENYTLTITPPTGAVIIQNYPVETDPDSAQEYSFTPNQVGTYVLTFTYGGQVYGAGGDGYSGSTIYGDIYEPSSASTNLTVLSTPIAAPTYTEPLPTAYWTHPVYGENSNWYQITSNWLGTGSPVNPAAGFNTLTGYTANALIERYPGDAVGSQTAHIMWTTPIETGGVVGGNDYSTPGVGYFEGTAYQQRFTNPIIIDGYLYYQQPVSFTGPNSGPLLCVNLQTGQTVWSSNTIPPLSFGYIYNLWDPDQHGTFPPMLVAAIGGGLTGLPSMWEFFDAYTGVPLFNVTGVPGFAAQTGQTLLGQPATALTYGTSMGPNGETIRDVFTNSGTAAAPNWYLAQWNSSRLWEYDINPYTYGGSLSPSVINASNGILIPTVPIPLTGETGTLPNGVSQFVPYGSSIIIDGSTTIAQGAAMSPVNSPTKYDWNVSVPWLNIMPIQPTYNAITGVTSTPAEQGPVQNSFAAGGTNPVTVLACLTLTT